MYQYETDRVLSNDTMIAIFIICLLIGIATYIIYGFFGSQIFKKTGTTPSWAAWVPIYGQWKFLETGGQQGWWMFVPVANVIFVIVAAYNIGLKFGKSAAWVALYIFIFPVWLILLGSKGSQTVKNPKQMNIVNVS